MRLARLEQEFQDFVLEGAREIEDAVVGTGRAPADVRLGIYAQAYRARLAEALQSNFPVLAQLLGGEPFDAMAHQYLSEHRSTRFSIRWYGDGLAHFLATRAPYLANPLLADLAQFEWSMTLAFDAAETALLQKGDLSALAPEQWAPLRLKPHPSVQVISIGPGAVDVWRACSRGETPPAQWLEDASPVSAGKASWILWRKGLQICFRAAADAEAAALRSLMQGENFGEICAAVAGCVPPDAAAGRAATLLARWLEDEMLAA